MVNRDFSPTTGPVTRRTAVKVLGGLDSGRDTPDARGPVPTGGGDAPAVGEERHAGDGGAVPWVRSQFLAALRVPEVHGVVVATRDDALAVGRKRCATGMRLVGLTLLQLLAGLHVPDAQRAVVARRQQTLAVR